MIWYFLAGFIAGVIGTLRFSKWVAEHVVEKEVDNDDERTG